MGESEMVFFGDNGQGDVLAVEMAQQHNLLIAAFIHQVQPLEKATTSWGEFPLEHRINKWEHCKIFFVRSPLAAAGKAAALGLIDESGLQAVCQAAKEELIALGTLYADAFPNHNRQVSSHNGDIQQVIADLRAAGLKWDFTTLAESEVFVSSTC